MGDLSPNFSQSEFDCLDDCTDQPAVDPNLVDKLEFMHDFASRLLARQAIVRINPGGGIRCRAYNERIRRCQDGYPGKAHGNFHGDACPICGGPGVQRSAKNSRHMDGTEADVTIPGMPPEVVAFAAQVIGFRNVGCYNTFTHLGVGGDPDRVAHWDNRTSERKVWWRRHAILWIPFRG